MSSLASNTISRTSSRSPMLSAAIKSPQAGPQFRKRWLHQTRSRQAIMMPAMSPFMTAGTITRWKKKEGEAFAPGDVLLQIESDIAMVDVEAESAGILGKILMPDGSTDVPVEQVIALVVKNGDLPNLASQVPTSSQYNAVPSPSSSLALSSPTLTESSHQPFLSSVHRSAVLTGIHQHHRGMATRQSRPPNLTIVPPSPRFTISLPIKPIASAKLHSGPTASEVTKKEENHQDSLMDGVALRRIFRSNLSQDPISSRPYNDITNSWEDNFDELL